MTDVDVTPEVLRQWPLPEPGGDKEAHGRVLVVGGSAQTPGAVLLAGEAALRAGCGKLQIGTVGSCAVPLAVAVPEGRVLPLPETADGMLGPAAADAVGDAVSQAGTVLVGPGLNDTDLAASFVAALVPHVRSWLVVDALASAFLTRHPDGVRHVADRCVVTVNPTELSRMLGRPTQEVVDDQAAAARAAAERTGAVVLCGGEHKVVAAPGGATWTVSAGCAGLGVSGSGDVQAGLVAGLLARGAEPAQAAVWGAELHGRSGERAAARRGPVGFLARELGAEVPRLLAELA